MKYPYIGKFINHCDRVVLFYMYRHGTVLENGRLEESKFRKGDFNSSWWDEKSSNITTEYLANTYGEVKSKEHAEFIKLLAENHDIPCGHKFVNDDCKYFYVIEGSLFFTHREVDFVSELKQINIPLPPESESEAKPKKVLSDGAVYELHDDGMYCRNNHYETCTVSFNFTDLETLKEASDFKVIEDEDAKIFKFEGINKPTKHFDCICTKCGGRCCIGNCDKWPKVGDEVEVSTGVGVIVLGPDNGGIYVIDINGDYAVRDIDGIKKPKTPEQELRDDIADLAFNQFNNDSYDLTHNSYYLASLLIDKYKITKKCEDDE